jgi:Flp pilus assembly protein TadG
MARANAHDERGAVTLEVVIGLPVLLLAVLLTINAALWYHARNTALAAAREGVRAARTYDSNIHTGQTAAMAFATSTGHGILLSPAVDTSGSSSTTVAIRVRGEAVSLLPGLHWHVDQIARGPVERWTTPTGS